MPIYEPVTNTYKINKHFALCKDEPLIIQQGSQGASKTVSDLMLIIDFFRNNPKKEITICSAEKTKLMDTAFNDLKKICIDWNIWDEFKWNDNKSILTKKSSNTGFIEFIGLDKEDIGKGRRRDIIYINEVNKVPYNKFFDISQRAKKVICDYNPDKRFYIHNLINDKNFIKLDFTGNEKLSKEEIRNILGYKSKGYLLDEKGDFILDLNGNRTVINQFFANKWQVYGEGNLGQVEGRIYNWQSIPYIEYLNINKETYYGVDWGVVDPFGVVECKYHDGNLYVHELNYASENEIRRNLGDTHLHQINASQDDGLVTWLFQKLNIPKNKTIVCDNNRHNKIIALRKAGWEYAVAVGGKSKLLDRIGILNGLNIYYTDTSKNIEHEQENYCRQKDKFGVVQEEPEDQDNHCFVGDTKITTINGDVKIKDIQIGDLVLTANGYKKVLKKFDNGVKEIKTFVLQFRTFSIYLECTENHKIKIGNKWIQAKDLHKHLTEKLTICISEKDTLVKEEKECTLLYGSIQTAKSQRDTTFITKTKTRLIMKSKISKLLKGLTTCKCTVKKEQKKTPIGLKTSKKRVMKSLRNGIGLKRVLNGTLNTQRITTSEISSTEQESVINAIMNTKQNTLNNYFAQTNALQKTEEIQGLTTSKENVLYANQSLRPINIQELELVGVRVEQGYHTNVWDIMVGENHEYFANGVLVHNCIDAIAYCVQKMFSLGIIKKV